LANAEVPHLAALPKFRGPWQLIATFRKRGLGMRPSIVRAEIVVLVLAVTVLMSQTARATGTWTSLAGHPTITYPGEVALLTDGTVIVAEGDSNAQNPMAWWKLTPDSHGSYQNGAWTQIASSHFQRHAAPSAILKDGRFLIAGGDGVYPGTDHSSVEIYDPVTHAWAPAQDMPGSLGDAASTMTADGRFYCGSSDFGSSATFFFDPARGAWSSGPAMATIGYAHEKGWTLLQDGTILDVFTNGARYDPAQNLWSTTKGSLPTGHEVTDGVEIGPMSLLYSGQVLQLGASASASQPGHSVIYDPINDSWASGPDAPDGLQWGDTPAAVLPNGNVLCETSNSDDGGGTAGAFWELDTTTNSFVSVPLPPSGAYFARFLQLPNGQVLLLEGPQMDLYTPSGAPQSAWRPTISGVQVYDMGTFLLSGTQLNGLTTGASFGDDFTMATNYPIAWLTDGSGNVHYLRTFGFDQMAPRPSTPGSCQFSVPNDSVPDGTYTVHVSANGVEASNTVPITFAGPHITSITAPVTVGNPGDMVSWTAHISAPAPSGGETLVLKSLTPSVARVPNFVGVPAGATSVDFWVIDRNYGISTIEVSTADNGRFVVSQNFGWTVTSLSGPSTPTNGNTATWSVVLSDIAPSRGVVVNLASSNTSAASVPATVTVPAGSNTATFTVTLVNGAAGLATITASLIGSSQSAQFGYGVQSLSGPPVPASGSTATWTVALNGVAPSGGVAVNLSSSRTATATVPASVTIPTGASSATFPVTLVDPNGGVSTITASLPGTSQTGQFGYTVSNLTVSPSTIHGSNNTAVGTVTLNTTAPAGGMVVNLAGDTFGTVVSVPASITIAAGATTGTFTATAVTDNGATGVSAKIGGVGRTVLVTIVTP
jgi:hypothetical protein